MSVHNALQYTPFKIKIKLQNIRIQFSVSFSIKSPRTHIPGTVIAFGKVTEMEWCSSCWKARNYNFVFLFTA